MCACLANDFCDAHCRIADPEWGGKADALAALRTLNKDEATKALRQAEKSDNEDVRRWARAELGRPVK